MVRRGDRVLLERPGQDSPLRGTWDLPALELPEDTEPRSRIRDELESRHGVEVRVAPRVSEVRHGIMQRRLRLQIYPCALRRGRVSGSARLRWIDAEALRDAAVSGATRKVLRAVAPDRPDQKA